MSDCSIGITYIEDSQSPSAPENLQVNPKSDRVTLSWVLNSEPDIKRYRIYSDTVPNPTVLIDSTNNSDTTKLVIGLKRGIKYYFRLTTIDSSSNESGYSNQVDNIKTSNKNVSNGWNLISIPLLVPDNRKEIIFPTSSSSAFAYQSTYVSSDTIYPGKGYWLKYEDDQLIPISGCSADIETVNVDKGWNMIGSISDTVSDSTIISIPPELITSPFFCYVNGPGYISSNTIVPGQGYWVKTNQNGKLILSSLQQIVSRNSIKIVATTEKPPQPPEVQTIGKEIPKEFALRQNYPNPFNPSTIISYQLPIDSYVKLKVYNLLGQEVAALVDREQFAGYHEAVWDASSFPSGVYYYQILASNFSNVKKMMMLR
jgi:hypothetical protein